MSLKTPDDAPWKTHKRKPVVRTTCDKPSDHHFHKTKNGPECCVCQEMAS